MGLPCGPEEPLNRSPLENSMFQEITIPMSLNDFARRERFKVGFGLMVETISRIAALSGLGEKVTTEWSQMQSADVRKLHGEMQAYVKTLQSIIRSIKEDDE